MSDPRSSPAGSSLIAATFSSHYERIDGTTWPVNVGDIEYALRYGDPASVRLVAASVVNAYMHLLDPDLTHAAAVAALRRARKAQANRG